MKLLMMCSKKVVNLCLQMAPLSAFVQKNRWKVSQQKGKYVARLLMLNQTIWLKGIQGTYVNKKLILLVALAKFQKSINWAHVLFNNLHFRLWDLSVAIKLKKKNSNKEIEFGVTHMLNIILQHWFLVDLSFQLLEFKDEDEKKDSFSIELVSNVKCKGLVPSPQGGLNDLDNPP